MPGISKRVPRVVRSGAGETGARAMSVSVKEYYRALYKQHGDNHNAVQWSDRRTQYKRFEILAGIDNKMRSLVDVGCGLGDMLPYLKARGFRGKYTGVDIVPEFIERCREKFSRECNASFHTLDVSRDPLPRGADYYLLSGAFNNPNPENHSFMLNCISKMFLAARKGAAFNALSTYVDYQVGHLYYSDPLEVFDFCKRKLTRKVVLRHDYLVKKNSIPFEYTIYLYT